MPAAPADAGSLPRALKVVATVVAPTTLITALLVYFGLLFAVGYFRYFGVNFTVLGLPTQDYLILSADAATVPLLILSTAALLALWIRGLPIERTTGRTRWLMRRVLMPVVALVGATLIGLAAADALFGARVFPATFWEARGLSLVVGVVLIGWAGRLHRGLATPRGEPDAEPASVVVARWVVVFMLVGIGLFWAVGSYAVGVGAAGAQSLADDLGCAPDVVLYSEKSLNLHVPGVVQTPPAEPDSAYGFRYTGLKLVPQSGNHFLFLPAGWVPNRQAAILLPRSDTLRLEFVAAGTGCS